MTKDAQDLDFEKVLAELTAAREVIACLRRAQAIDMNGGPTQFFAVEMECAYEALDKYCEVIGE